MIDYVAKADEQLRHAAASAQNTTLNGDRWKAELAIAREYVKLACLQRDTELPPDPDAGDEPDARC